MDAPELATAALAAVALTGRVDRKGACRVLGISMPTLERWYYAGAIPAVRITPGKRGRLVFRLSDLHAHLEARLSYCKQKT